MKNVLLTILTVHLILAPILFITMDMDLGGGALRRALDALIDGYETLGFGSFLLGMLWVTLIVGVLWFVLRSRDRAHRTG